MSEACSRTAIAAEQRQRRALALASSSTRRASSTMSGRIAVIGALSPRAAPLPDPDRDADRRAEQHRARVERSHQQRDGDPRASPARSPAGSRASRLSQRARLQLGGDALLNRCHRPERLLQVAARQPAQLSRDRRSRRAPRRRAAGDLMLACAARRSARTRPPASARRRPAACRRLPAARSRSTRRCAGHAGRHPGPSCQVDDRDHAAVLEVEPAAVLAAVLDDEPAQKAGRRAVGERKAREHAAAAPSWARRSRNVSATGVPVCTPQTGRLSTSTEARISAFS